VNTTEPTTDEAAVGSVRPSAARHGAALQAENPEMTTSARTHGCSSPRAFTLIELLVVVAIIALLISILLPSLGRAREQTKATVCSSNLHQLGISVNYYVDENNSRIPYMRGYQATENTPPVAPFMQTDLMFHFWKYIKDMKIYVCPSARDFNSTQWLYRDPANAPRAFDPSSRGSVYALDEQDSNWEIAKRDNYFPQLNIAEIEGDGRLFIPQIYTEYFFNDWQGTSHFLYGQIPGISGSSISQMAVPAQVVVMNDARHEIVMFNDPIASRNARRLRHFESSNLLFLDGHAERVKWINFLDTVSEARGETPKDFDDFGNRTFWLWGVSKRGINNGADARPASEAEN
jgi:prepilin-type N-terminal cleavage/methylation domain-containing protein/prepilin-type processing-associated H-X9-DG protein